MSKDISGEFQSLIMKKQYRLALTKVDEALQNNPDDYMLLSRKSSAHSLLKQENEAIEAIEQAIKLNEQEPMLHFSKGEKLLRFKQFYEAIDALTDAIKWEIYHNSSYYIESAYFFRALAHYNLSQYEQCKADLEHVDDDHFMYILGGPQSKPMLLEQLDLKYAQ